MARKTLTEKTLPLFEAEADLEQKITALRSLKIHVVDSIRKAQNELDEKKSGLQNVADEFSQKGE